MTVQILVAAIPGVRRLLPSAFVRVKAMGYAVCTLVIARSEGGPDRKALESELERGPVA